MTEKQIDKLKSDIQKYLIFVARDNAECVDLEYTGLASLGKRQALAEITCQYLEDKTFRAECVLGLIGIYDVREVVKKEY